MGFPVAGRNDRGIPAEQVSGVVQPVSGDAAGKLVMRVGSTLPERKQSWQGLSGAGVCDQQHRLLGIVGSVPPDWEKTRLHAIPIGRTIDVIADDAPQWVQVLGSLSIVQVAEAEATREPAQVAFDGGKLKPAMTNLKDRSLFNVLHFSNRVVPYTSRTGKDASPLATVVAWAEGDLRAEPDVRVMTVTGPAGAGQSRLAAEACDKLTKFGDSPWRVGFVDYDCLTTAAPPVQPLLMVCDYAEQAPAVIAAFVKHLQVLQEARLLQAPVRVLMLARQRGDWYRRFRDSVEDPQLLRHRHVTLQASDFDVEEHTWAAVTAFANGLGKPVPEALTFDPNNLDRPLTAHIAALLMVLGDDATGKRAQLLDRLISRESRRWLKCQTDTGVSVFDHKDNVKQALCVTTLTAQARSHLFELLCTTEPYANVDSERAAIVADALHQLYPGPHRPRRPDAAPEKCVAPVEPDLIAAHMLATTDNRSDIVNQLAASQLLNDVPGYRARFILALSLAAEDYPIVQTDFQQHLAVSLEKLVGTDDAGGGIIPLLRQRLSNLVTAAVRLTDEHQDPTAARQLATALTLPAAIADPSITETATTALHDLPYPHPALSGLGVALAKLAMTHYETRHTTKAYKPAFAAAHSNLGTWLSDNGDSSTALTHTQRAVEVYEELVEGNRAVHLPDLAGSVNNLASRLAEAGRRQQAIEQAQRAVEVYMELVGGNRAAYLPALAGSVWMSAHVRSVLGVELEAARGYCDWSEALYADLAATEPAAFTNRIEAVRGLKRRIQ